jgi:hypothetical protein
MFDGNPAVLGAKRPSRASQVSRGPSRANPLASEATPMVPLGPEPVILIPGVSKKARQKNRAPRKPGPRQQQAILRSRIKETDPNDPKELEQTLGFASFGSTKVH